jgi:hypothetical protein
LAGVRRIVLISAGNRESGDRLLLHALQYLLYALLQNGPRRCNRCVFKGIPKNINALLTIDFPNGIIEKVDVFCRKSEDLPALLPFCMTFHEEMKSQ